MRGTTGSGTSPRTGIAAVRDVVRQMMFIQSKHAAAVRRVQDLACVFLVVMIKGMMFTYLEQMISNRRCLYINTAYASHTMAADHNTRLLAMLDRTVTVLQIDEEGIEQPIRDSSRGDITGYRTVYAIGGGASYRLEITFKAVTYDQKKYYIPSSLTRHDERGVFVFQNGKITRFDIDDLFGYYNNPQSTVITALNTARVDEVTTTHMLVKFNQENAMPGSNILYFRFYKQ